jgi:uncharacterized protein YraI
MRTKEPKTRALRLSLAVLALAMAARTPAALALVATVMTNVHLRAGPSTFYPTVALLGSGSTVQVFGCEHGSLVRRRPVAGPSARPERADTRCAALLSRQ